MSVPVLVLMLASMITAMTVSLRDHAAHAAAGDLAEIRAEHAATHFVSSCISAAGCAPPETEGVTVCAAQDDGLVVSAQVAWSPLLWKALTPVTSDRVVAYDAVLGAGLRARAAAAVTPC
ncbi:MAG: hypothetical protein OXE79_06615 [Acidimicrobiaceae bacterium]|nr:hypothetical protein [Acidimicrobiaceae bacterium]MCY4176204.1 hypothetical protein [Acidimicrobiaceae bacterium]MCY4280691.1 hypothetical protein [Acidimicrobiaceae bacterium]MCY4294407.1 hypothetical protein [Acidimicrobiaceae bacterium]